ncbi:MAG TPA: triose-phosphate isomerase, partial [Armatimonadetes bacterium]|nr:triose-phosphate isomerase [Armatimonadota bacterium]
MRTPMVAGNWKLNGTRASADALAQEVASGAQSLNNVEVLVCPTYIHIPGVQGVIAASNVKLGAQDASIQESGAYTGEVSTAMLQEFG